MGRHHQDLRAFALGRRRDILADEIEAAQLGHHVVDDEHVDGPLAQQTAGLAGTGRLDDLVAGVAQRAPQRLEDLFLVVDEQDGSASLHQRPGGV